MELPWVLQKMRYISRVVSAARDNSKEAFRRTLQQDCHIPACHFIRCLFEPNSKFHRAQKPSCAIFQPANDGIFMAMDIVGLVQLITGTMSPLASFQEDSLTLASHRNGLHIVGPFGGCKWCRCTQDGWKLTKP
jgi:hypothetical protein